MTDDEDFGRKDRSAHCCCYGDCSMIMMAGDDEEQEEYTNMEGSLFWGNWATVLPLALGLASRAAATQNRVIGRSSQRRMYPRH